MQHRSTEILEQDSLIRQPVCASAEVRSGWSSFGAATNAATTAWAALAPKYQIETERLLLSPIDPAVDVYALHAYLSREKACRYTHRTPMTREKVVVWLRNPDLTRPVLNKPGRALAPAVVLRETGELIGDAILAGSQMYCGSVASRA